MKIMTIESLNEIITHYERYIKNRYALIDLNYLFLNLTIPELKSFCLLHGIPIPTEISQEKVDLIINILTFFYEKFQNSKEIAQMKNNPLDFLGDTLFAHLNKTNSPFMYDFPSKTELINVFGDFCADLGITVYNAEEIQEYKLNLFLTKKNNAIFTVTESVFVMTGTEYSIDRYNEILANIARSSLIAEWKVFVTTPAVALKIGFDKLIADMKRLHTWLYIISPRQKRIFGVTKGSKSKSIDSDLQTMFIQNLPHTPIRTPSQVVNISKFDFSERKAYKPKEYQIYRINSQLINQLEENQFQACSENDIAKNFKSLIIIDKNSSLSLYKYSKDDLEDQLISGFLSAMDTFVENLSGKSSLEEINYQGFMINAGEGKLIKVIVILSKTTTREFKERLKTFTAYFEDNFTNEIMQFKKTADQSVFNKEKIDDLVCHMLSI